jgi:hypothetical protein
MGLQGPKVYKFHNLLDTLHILSNSPRWSLFMLDPDPVMVIIIDLIMSGRTSGITRNLVLIPTDRPAEQINI